MKLEQLVLPEDLRFAYQLYESCRQCINLADHPLVSTLERRRFERDYQNAMRELKDLMRKRFEKDKLESMYRSLEYRGIDTTVIRQKTAI